MKEDTNHTAPIPAEAGVTVAAVRALCCQCGQLNTFPTKAKSPRQPGVHNPGEVGLGFGGAADPYAVPADDDTDGWARCVMQRRCPNCRTHTTHAILREGPHRDWLEDTHRQCGGHGRSDHYCHFCRPGIERMHADRRRWDARHGKVA